ncbi:MAG: UDP-4-amino-4,6-dideoxy-N-acetyl-beta-L-altrosamine transaminase [Alphaproteobacteria bacterium]
MSGAERPWLPYGRHSIDEDDLAAVVATLKSGWLTTGPAVTAFEEAFAGKVGARFAVACSSGTAGLHLAALALGLGEGAAVVVPTLTFLATANAARYVGAEVAFADVDPDSGLMTETNLEAALAGAAGHTQKAVFPVHMNGQCGDMASIAKTAKEHGLAVVEDACHAIGASYEADGELVPVGACRHSDMAVFSLHPVKTITMGEGGVVTTNDEALYERLRRLRNHGMTWECDQFENSDLAYDARGNPNPWYYEMASPGLNYRASDIHCALGLSQLKKLERFVSARALLAARYDELFRPHARVIRPIRRVVRCRPAWHLYVVLIDFEATGVDRATVMRRLHAASIGTQVHYVPVHLQPYYRKRYGRLHLPDAELYYAHALSLPLFPAMSEADVERVTRTLTRELGLVN